MKPTVCFVNPNELHKLRGKSAFAPANITGLSEILSDLEVPMNVIAIISSQSGQNDHLQAPVPLPEEDKENVSPPYSPNSSFSSVEEGIDGSGKPLPLQKLANLSVVTNGTPLDQLFDQTHSSVRQTYSFGVSDRLPEGKARLFLSSILAELKQLSLPSWMPNGVAVIVPFADQSPPFTSLACCLLIGPKDSSNVRCINVKCLNESVPRNHLPYLQELKRRMARTVRSKEEPQERFEAVYSLGAVTNDDDGCHVTVRYTAEWKTCTGLLDRPTSGDLGQLLVRPLFGHPKSQLYFIFQGIERLKVLSAAVSAQANAWESEVDTDSFSKNLIPNFRQLCVLAGAIDRKYIVDKLGPDADADCSLLTDPSDPAPRWRNIVARRKRDVTEVLWTVIRDVNTHKALRHHMQSLLRYLVTEKLSYSVDRSNDTGLALVLRRLKVHGVPDFSNGLELLIEVGFYALHRDLAAVLAAVLEANKNVLRDLQPVLDFFAEEGMTTREERLHRLGRLHRACEFAALLGQHCPGKEIGRNVRQIFNVLKDKPVDELVFHSVNSAYLPLDCEAPTSWSVALEYSNGLMVKQLFKRSAHEVINTYDPSFAKFTCLEILTKTLCV